MMKSYLIVVAMIVSYSSPVLSSDINEEVEKARKIMKKREANITANLASLEKLKLDNPNIKIKHPAEYMTVKSIPLTCKRVLLNWGRKEPGYQYEGCEFKYNTSDMKQVGQLYAAIQVRINDGWELVKTKVYSQNIHSPERIETIEQYLFKKDKK